MGAYNSKVGGERKKKIEAFHEELEIEDDPSTDTDLDLAEVADNVELTMAASRADPEHLRKIWKKSAHPVHRDSDAMPGIVSTPLTLQNSFGSEDMMKNGANDSSNCDADMAVLNINPGEIQYPFENIIMEGGGNKGLAYVGSIKCLEDLGMISQFKRIGGTSAGAITAALLAFGYKSHEVFEFLSQDIDSIFNDHSCGYLSLLPNLINQYGWNPGKKINEWFGGAIKDKTGDPDTTFYELYKSTGMELCIVVTNLNLMTAQHCHVKTTPDMPIRDALCMTMAIPGMFAAIHYDNHGQKDVFVDGGVIANYPINCFDGWYLSMQEEDAFLNKVKNLDDLPNLMSGRSRFQPTGPNKTMGLLLYEDTEPEIMRRTLERRIGAELPAKPEKATLLYLEKEQLKRQKKTTKKNHERVVEAVTTFLKVLHSHHDVITREDLRETLNDERFTEEHRKLLFGRDLSLSKVFDILDRDHNNEISLFELKQFVEERGIRMQTRYQGFTRRRVDNLASFLNALQSTLLNNLKYVIVNQEDVSRTVGINTGHVGTMDFVLEEEDRKFAVDRGYNATMSFLRYYAVNHPDDVKFKGPRVHSSQPTSIHDGSNGHQESPSASDAESLLRRRLH